ncbi:MAG: hypothetical protein ACLRFH_00935 [Opitutales bacterium]
MSIGSWSASKGISSGRNATADTMECCTHSFIANAGIKETELVWNFFNMVEFSGATVKGMKSLDFSSDFSINMLKAFEEFDNLEPKGLITQQFTALAQKCADKGVKVLIGEDPNLSKISGICIESGRLINDHYIFINISEELVKKAMENPIYVIQQEGDNIPEIKAIPLGNLVARTMVADFDDSNLVAKCAVYLLFHELFHVNSYHFEFAGDGTLTDPENFEKSHKFPENVKSEDINLLIAGKFRYDDLRNVTEAKTETEIRVPGEYELLQALYPNKKIMRLYEGKFLDFSNPKVLAAAVKVARFENDCLNSKSDSQQLLNNEELGWEIETFLKKHKDNKNTFEYKSLEKLKNNLNNFIKMQKKQSLDFVQIDNSVWKAQADEYMQAMTKNLENTQLQNDINNGTYIPSK